MLTHTELQNMLDLFDENFAKKTNLPNWFTKSFKTNLSRNLTIEDWNTYIKYVLNNSSDINSIREYLTSLVTYLDTMDLTLSGRIDNVEVRVNDMATNVNTLSNNITLAINSMNTYMSTVTSDIHNLQDAVNSNTTAINRHTNDITNEASTREAADTALDTKIDNLLELNPEIPADADLHNLNYLKFGGNYYLGMKGAQGDKGEKGDKGDTGSGFDIKLVYDSIEAMNNNYATDNLAIGDLVAIRSNVDSEENAKVYTKGESAYVFFLDLSGATGVQGPKGDKGDTGAQGIQGEKGDTGLTGAQGIQGIQGNTGGVPTLITGTTTTLDPDSSAKATLVPTANADEYQINFELVKGDKGDKGDKGENASGYHCKFFDNDGTTLIAECYRGYNEYIKQGDLNTGGKVFNIQ